MTENIRFDVLHEDSLNGHHSLTLGVPLNDLDVFGIWVNRLTNYKR